MFFLENIDLGLFLEAVFNIIVLFNNTLGQICQIEHLLSQALNKVSCYTFTLEECFIMVYMQWI